MKEQFVSYEIAVKLKQLGFDEKCILTLQFTNDVHYLTKVPFEPSMYICGKKKVKCNVPLSVLQNDFKNEWMITLNFPLWQQVIDFLREKHKIQLEILWRGDMSMFCYKLGKFHYGSHQFSGEDFEFKDYNEAREQAILKALTLIK